MNKSSSILFSLILFLCSSFLFAANAETTDWQKNQLIPLQRMTVGPWDNFSPAPTPSGDIIYLTRTQNQIPQIIRYTVATRKTELLIGDDGDAKHPALSPDGEILAYTSFQNDARGDICYIQLSDNTKQCINSFKTTDANPFWIDSKHIGLLRKQPGNMQWELLSHDLKTNTQQKLHSGNISAPAASHDGRYIIFNVVNTSDRQYPSWHPYIIDLQGENTRALPPFDLPGIPGFYAFSRNDQHIYFNHYLSDTNNDQKIDANDHSVAFRLQFPILLNTKDTSLPEQLTSVEENCSFPAVSSNKLFLTCAYQGSLDIYQIALSGTVPSDWNTNQLWEAHRIARTVEQRQLIINTLRFRRQTDPEYNDTALLERLLSLHLQSGELTAVSYYLTQLQQRYRESKNISNEKYASFYEHLELLTNILSRKAQESHGILTARFQQFSKNVSKEVDTIPDWPNLKILIQAYIDATTNQASAALEKLNDIPLSTSTSLLPLERYLTFELYKEILSSQPDKLLRHYPSMFNSAGLTSESRIYYAFNYLKLLASTSPDIATRLKAIKQQMDDENAQPLSQLFKTELTALQLTRESDSDKGKELFRALSKTLNNSRKNPLLRKAMHTRSIQILGDASLFNYMERMSRNWLLNTHITEMEFANTAKQYSLITMDKAYGMLADGELKRAYSTFYSAIRQTSDLEAHYQFISTGLTRGIGLEDNLKKSYELLEKQNILGNRDNYAAALKELLSTSDSTAKTRSESLSVAKELLGEPVRGLGSAMYDLLRGYIAHSQLELSRRGFSFSEDLFQEAHHHYIMALDLGRDNSRISAASWENLAWLHFQVRHYALSADFFQKRLQLPFTDLEHEAACRLSYARSLFYNNDTVSAWYESETALKLAITAELDQLSAYREKSAFYAMQAKAYIQANDHYTTLLSMDNALSPHNKVRSLLAHGYTQMKLNKLSEARKLFLQTIAAAEKLKPTTNGRLLISYPQRQQLLAYGLLAKISAEETDKIRYRTAHLKLLRVLKGKTQTFALKESQRLSQITRDLNQLAASYESIGKYKKMANTIQDSVTAAIAWKQESGDNIGPVIYHTLLNYMTLAIDHKSHFNNVDNEQIRISVSDLIENLESLKETSPQLAARAELVIAVQKRYLSVVNLEK